MTGFGEYTPSLPFAQAFHKIGRIKMRRSTGWNGYYAETFLENIGWRVEHSGITREKAAENLRDYITSGRFDEVRNS